MFKNTFQVIQSTLAAMIGVQKSSKLKHDFQQKTPLPFIISGIIFAVIFVLSIITIVKLILA